MSRLSNSELLKARTVSETFQYITPTHLENIAAAALCLLGVLPVLCAFADHYLKSGLLVLYRCNSSIGYMGIIYGLFLLLWRHYQPKNLRPRRTFIEKGLPLFLLLMLIWSIFSCIFSTNPKQSFMGDWYRLDGLVSYFAYAGIFIFATQIRRRSCWRNILNFFTGAACVLALVCLLNISKLNFFLNMVPERAIFFNINHYGYYLCMALPAAVGLMVTVKPDGSRKPWLYRGIYCIEIALLTNSLIGAKSFGPLLAVMCYWVLILVLGFFIDRKKFKYLLVGLAVFILSAAISSAGTWNIFGDFQRTSSDIGVASESIGEGTSESEELDKIGSGRGRLWVYAVKFIQEKPIFGYGPDNLGEAYTLAGCKNDRAHNEILQYAASLGIPAAVFYIAGLFCLLLEFIKKFRSLNMDILAVFGVVGSYLASSMVGNTMFYTSPFFFMLLGLAYGLIKAVPPPQKLG